MKTIQPWKGVRCSGAVLPPRSGAFRSFIPFPRLAPWAMFFRPIGLNVKMNSIEASRHFSRRHTSAGRTLCENLGTERMCPKARAPSRQTPGCPLGRPHRRADTSVCPPVFAPLRKSSVPVCEKCGG